MFVTYGLLTLAIVSLWVPEQRLAGWGRYLWLACLGAAVASGLGAGYLEWQAAGLILLLSGACFVAENRQASRRARMSAGLGVVGLAIAFGLHAAPGFNNPVVLANVTFSPESLPYTLHFNFDKPLLGLFLLAFGHRRLAHWHEWRALLRSVAPIALVTVFGVVALALVTGYVRFEPKWVPSIWIWAWANLFFTCVAEEAVFRGFVQKHFTTALSGYPYGPVLALFVSAILFGLAHMGGGARYVLLATLAGVGYGWAYQSTQRIEGSILLHFLVNLTHILGFSYPALRAGVAV